MRNGGYRDGLPGYPYAKHRLAKLMDGQANVQAMNFPHPFMAKLILALACAKPDYCVAVNLCFTFWLCAFGSVYMCGLGRRRMAVCLRDSNLQ